LIDGDTFDVGSVRVRLYGIDAPEAGQRCQHANWDCGTEATNRLAQLVQGKNVNCHAVDWDRFGRIVARCFASGIDLASALTASGLAWAYVRFSGNYVGLEAKARSEYKGVWRAANQTPWDYRAAGWNHAAASGPRPRCPIKGNISTKGERIYHTPWPRAYAKTKINEGKGERWFCDEAEAVANGWRAARER